MDNIPRINNMMGSFDSRVDSKGVLGFDRIFSDAVNPLDPKPPQKFRDYRT